MTTRRGTFWKDSGGYQTGRAFAVLFGAGTLAIVLVICAIVYFANGHACSQQAAGLGVHHRYGLFAGCRVEVNGRYVPLHNYRVVAR